MLRLVLVGVDDGRVGADLRDGSQVDVELVDLGITVAQHLIVVVVKEKMPK